MARLQLLRKEKDPESLFLSHLKWIEKTATMVARRRGYDPEDAKDFCSHIKTKLLEDDYAVLRKFRNRSSLHLYLKTVIHRLYIDYEIARRGKWRPSTTAQNIGPIAVQLEELMHWKHHSFEEACEILDARYGKPLNRHELYTISTKLPKRWGKTTIQFVPLNDSPVPGPFSPPHLEEAEKAQLLQKLLTEAIHRLSGPDRLMLKMRFQDDFTFVEIARMVKKKKMQVYGQLRKILADMQQQLLSGGFSASEVRQVLRLEGKRIDVNFSIIRNENGT